MRDYDTTVARIAGNILGGMIGDVRDDGLAVGRAVRLAWKVVDEVRKTSKEVPTMIEEFGKMQDESKSS